MTRNVKLVLFALAVGWLTLGLLAQGTAVRGRIDLFRADGSARTDKNAGIVVWLTPIPKSTGFPEQRASRTRPSIVQRNKRFETRVLAVEVGSWVDFPNRDPFFHNVFSLFDGTRFDLGLYEAGSTKGVQFKSPGVCYIFCNIHSQMNAVVVVVDTPHFVLLSTPGEFQIPDVPPGRYRLSVWAERCSPELLTKVARPVSVEGASMSLGTIRLQESRDVASVHVNKYGKDYDTPVFSGPIYSRP